MRLTIRTALWRSHVARVASSIDGLVPVVKGNGYGFGRRWLAETAAEFADTIAVGTIHELDELPPSVTAVVLTPSLTVPILTVSSSRSGPHGCAASPILTVGNDAHLSALAGWNGRVVVKIESSMRRYGQSPRHAGMLIDTARRRGLDVAGVSIHPPLVGTAADHAAEITTLIADIDRALPVWVSHLDAAAYATLPRTHTFRLRLGTQLWHGDKSTLHLTADVLDVRDVNAGDQVGYRLGTIAADGHVVMVGAGTANGVTVNDATTTAPGRSPFHFAQHRLELHEPPHMHTSMCFVPNGAPLPNIGDRVDVQRPLTMTQVDEYEWL
jgi:alanine racemase